MNIDFQETQRFNQWYLWLPLTALGCFPIFAIYQQIIMGQPVGDKPMSDLGLILFSLFVIVLLLFFGMLKLETQIDEQGISITFFPLTKKRIIWSDIKSAEVLNYGFVGGWGIRIGTKYGTVYNVKGKMGLAIELQNGKRYCVGTQQAESLKALITEIKRRHGLQDIQ